MDNSMSVIVAATMGFLPVLLLALIIVAVLVYRSRRQEPEDGQRTTGVVLDTRSQRRNVGPTGLVGYQALVRFTAFDGRMVETWAPTALPPKKWKVPGQHVVVGYSLDDPWAQARVRDIL